MDGIGITVVAGVLVVGVLALLWRAISTRTVAGAEFAVADIIKVRLQLGIADKQYAKEALHDAAAQRGQVITSDETGVIDGLSQVKLTRLLWVDDKPDGNQYETLALERLGFLITKATSTEGGMFYLRHMDFEVAITDLGRPEGSRAGVSFISGAHELNPDLPVIIYTFDADRVQSELASANAVAVVDRPADLIQAVMEAQAMRS